MSRAGKTISIKKKTLLMFMKIQKIPMIITQFLRILVPVTKLTHQHLRKMLKIICLLENVYISKICVNWFLIFIENGLIVTRSYML